MRQESVKNLFTLRGLLQLLDFLSKQAGHSRVRYLPRPGYEE
ncbi:hypothetical protein [Pseudomonas kurunegalensis]|nr:hypothetical protein [Pseudomonas kurunegalensis]WJD60965.1 hypothetical protein QQ992_18745 [Pseudomonas kurunegalensis]